jgi:hypothetical protein
MKRFRIYKHIKGHGLFRKSPYLGEMTETEPANIGGTRGFHNSNHGERNVVKFFDDDGGNGVFMQRAYIIDGKRNLMSHLKRIVDRISDGILDDADELIITIEEE